MADDRPDDPRREPGPGPDRGAADEPRSGPVPPPGAGAGTATLAGARDHARSQVRGRPGAPSAGGLTVPARAAAADLPEGAGDATLLWAETVGGGGYASRRLPRGAVLRLTDTLGDACVQLLVHNARQPAERLNVADTVKVQWQAYLREGALLLSDLGRVLMTVVADTSGRHDCLCGCSVRRANDARYGDGHAGGAHPNGRDLLALGLAKLGLERRDVGPNVTFFKSARVAADGALHLEGEPRPGTHVDLRAEVDVLVALADTPHPLDERETYTATPVRCLAWLPAAPAGEDPFRTATPERERAFLNTDEHLAGWAS